MKRDYDTLTYINLIGKTVGTIKRLDDELFEISYTDDFKEYLKYKDIRLLAEEGQYKRLPERILNRIPAGNSQNEIWSRKKFHYTKDYFDPIAWLNLLNGRSLGDTWTFTKEPLDYNIIKYFISELKGARNDKQLQNNSIHARW